MARVRKTVRIGEFRARLLAYMIENERRKPSELWRWPTRPRCECIRDRDRRSLFQATQFLSGPSLVVRIGAIQSDRSAIVIPVEACLFLVSAQSRVKWERLSSSAGLARRDDPLRCSLGDQRDGRLNADPARPHAEGKAAVNVAVAAATMGARLRLNESTA